MRTALSCDALYHACDPSEFTFTTTADLPDAPAQIHQERARDAIAFGLGIQREGYNLFVMGPAGAGKHALVESYLKTEAPADAPLLDWVYVNNFAQPHKPTAHSKVMSTAPGSSKWRPSSAPAMTRQ